MKFIPIISKVLTLVVFATFGITAIFFFKAIIEKAEQNLSTHVTPPIKEKVGPCFFGSIKEEMPRFPGCEHIEEMQERKQCSQKKMLEYIYGEIKYPATDRALGIEGTVVVRFYIDTEGNVVAPEIVRDIGGDFGKEVLRVVRSMNDLPEKWIPGKQRGKAVKVYYNLPVKIRLE